MNAPFRQPKPVYPGKVAIRHAIEAARTLGIDVGGFEISPDGTIRVIDARALPKAPGGETDLFEECQAKGLI